MSKGIYCDICGKIEPIRDEYSSNKIMIRDGEKASGKFTDYDLCHKCLESVLLLLEEIRNRNV